MSQLRRLALLAFAVLLSLGLLPPVSAATPAADRERVISEYQSMLEPLLMVPTGSTANARKCRAGTISAENATATLKAVNYVRRLAALPAVKLNAKLSKKAQAAALFMSANDYLTHRPPRSGRCWSQSAYDGASHGNLYLGWSSGSLRGALFQSTGPRAVVGYMVDPGENNRPVGHRRWIMYQQLLEVGTGDSQNSNSLYVVSGNQRPKRGNKWVAWPTAGYFPRELEPEGRWSLSYPGASFAAAKVSATGPDGAPLKVTRYSPRNGYADNTLVWQVRLPAAYRAYDAADFTVSVRVSGIRLPSGKTVSHSWTTTLIKAAAFPDWETRQEATAAESLLPLPDGLAGYLQNMGYSAITDTYEQRYAFSYESTLEGIQAALREQLNSLGYAITESAGEHLWDAQSTKDGNNIKFYIEGDVGDFQFVMRIVYN